jgi:hypothetical protein
MAPTPNIKGITMANDGPVAGAKSVLFFWAPWHEGSCPGGLMDEVFTSLAKSSDGSTKSVQFLKVEAELFPSISQKVRTLFPNSGSDIVSDTSASEKTVLTLVFAFADFRYF